MSENAFGLHTAKLLVEAYKKKFWQGQNPRNAKIIFLGLDANWDPDIESNSELYPEVLKYLEDGVAYWKEKNIHHPFLLPSYKNGGGSRYHTNFAKTGITSKCADYVSFVELLPIPTYGRSSKNKKLFEELIDSAYLQELNSIIFSSSPKIVFIAKTVYNEIERLKKIGILQNAFEFEKKLDSSTRSLNKLISIDNRNDTHVVVHTHFSASISNKHKIDIGNLAMSFINKE